MAEPPLYLAQDGVSRSNNIGAMPRVHQGEDRVELG
jgi:hypothetical protein